MPGVEERLAYLEGRMQEHSQTIVGIRDAIVSLDRRIEGLDRKVDVRFAALEARVSRQFFWIIGVQVTTLTAIVVALSAR